MRVMWQHCYCTLLYCMYWLYFTLLPCTVALTAAQFRLGRQKFSTLKMSGQVSDIYSLLSMVKYLLTSLSHSSFPPVKLSSCSVPWVHLATGRWCSSVPVRWWRDGRGHGVHCVHRGFRQLLQTRWSSFITNLIINELEFCDLHN